MSLQSTGIGEWLGIEIIQAKVAQEPLVCTACSHSNIGK